MNNGSHNSDRSRPMSFDDRSASSDRDGRHGGRFAHEDRSMHNDRPGTSQRQQLSADDDRGMHHEGGRWRDAGHGGPMAQGYGHDQGQGREQGYSSSNQAWGQQGRDRGQGYDDRAASAQHRQGYGTDRDLDDRTSRAGYRLDGDLDSREIGGRSSGGRDMQDREAWGFSERDRSERDRGDHQGFDDRGIGAPQRNSQYGSPSRDGRDVAGRSSFSTGMSSHGMPSSQGGSYGASSHGMSSSQGGMSSGMGNHGARYPSGPKGYTRSDDRIKEDVCDRLAAMGDLDSSDIEVSVTAGEVTLAGTVPHRSMKYRAEQTCELVTGVKDIVNHVRVKDLSRSSSPSSSPSSSSSSASSVADTKSMSANKGEAVKSDKPTPTDTEKHDDKTTRRQ